MANVDETEVSLTMEILQRFGPCAAYDISTLIEAWFRIKRMNPDKSNAVLKHLHERKIVEPVAVERVRPIIGDRIIYGLTDTTLYRTRVHKPRPENTLEGDMYTDPHWHVIAYTPPDFFLVGPVYSDPIWNREEADRKADNWMADAFDRCQVHVKECGPPRFEHCPNKATIG